MANFWPKPWTNPFGKISIFRLYELLVFIGYKGVFFVSEYRKTFFGLIFPKIKSWKNGQFLAKTMD